MGQSRLALKEKMEKLIDLEYLFPCCLLVPIDYSCMSSFSLFLLVLAMLIRISVMLHHLWCLELYLN